MKKILIVDNKIKKDTIEFIQKNIRGFENEIFLELIDNIKITTDEKLAQNFNGYNILFAHVNNPYIEKLINEIKFDIVYLSSGGNISKNFSDFNTCIPIKIPELGYNWNNLNWFESIEKYIKTNQFDLDILLEPINKNQLYPIILSISLLCQMYSDSNTYKSLKNKDIWKDILLNDSINSDLLNEIDRIKKIKNNEPKFIKKIKDNIKNLLNVLKGEQSIDEISELIKEINEDISKINFE